MITLSNNHILDFVVASGALGWDGRGWWWEKPLYYLGLLRPSLFTITTKTLTDTPRKGTPYKILPLWGGVWNNVGLANPGFEWWVNHKLPYLAKDIPLLVSLYPESLDFIKEAADLLSDYSTIKGIEINFSCPNVREFNLNVVSGFIRNLKNTRLPVILKLNAKQIWDSAESGTLRTFLNTISSLVEAISLNAVPVSMFKGDTIFKSGAFSGNIVKTLNWNTADKIRRLGFDNVIFPSLWSYNDIRSVKQIFSAKAVSFGSVHLLRPAAPTRWVMHYVLEEGAGVVEINKGISNV